MTKLSVNINKIASIRNARGGNVPNLLNFAVDCERFGADGITIHPRPDERHITKKDAYELKDAVQSSVEEAATLMVDMELNFIDKIFETGNLANLNADDLKEFIKKRANEKLNELGYESIFQYNKEMAANLDWFYHLTGGTTHTDFFAIRPTDYSKAGENENWDEDELFS